MAGTKLPPRQRMINMMYLVLTAMLALNVTAEVLNAFKTVDDGIGRSNRALQTKNASLFNDFGIQMGLDSKKAAPCKAKADASQQICKELYDKLEVYKQQIIKEAGGYDTKTGQLVHNDDIDIATRLFVERGEGAKLRLIIEQTISRLLSLAPEQDRSALAASMPLIIDQPHDGLSWEFHKFNHVPTVAAVTLLSKYQNDALATENQLVEQFYKEIDATAIKVDRLTALVSSPSSYIMQGLSYSADVMLTAYSSTQNPDVFLGSFTPAIRKNANGSYDEIRSASENPPLVNPHKIDVSNGLGKIEMPGSQIGQSQYTGVIRIKDPSGSGYKFYPFEGEYQVAAKSAVVSPTNMNVLYAGLDNPISVSVPGVAQKDVTAVFDGPGVLDKKPDGSYVIRPSTKGTGKVLVTAKVGGRSISMGEMSFRVKKVPNPQPYIDGIYNGGNISLSKFRSTTGMVPKLEFFDFPARFNVVSYKISLITADGIKPFECKGPLYDSKFRDIMHSLKKGQSVFFDDIIVRGPEGENRNLPSIAFVLTN